MVVTPIVHSGATEPRDPPYHTQGRYLTGSYHAIAIPSRWAECAPWAFSSDSVSYRGSFSWSPTPSTSRLDGNKIPTTDQEDSTMTPETDTSSWATHSGRRHLLARLPLVAVVATLACLVPFPHSVAAGDFTTLQWANQAIHLQQAWQVVPNRGAGISVCDVDSGAMVDHPDLKGAIIGGINTADATAPSSYADDEGHGTYTAGIILARGKKIWGVAPGASLLVAKALNQQADGAATGVTAGILWCIEQGAQVINLSIGGPVNTGDGFPEAIAFGCQQGVDFAVAAGNDGAPKKPINPANVDSPCLLTVNASDRHDHLAAFSNYGENKRTVTAPGQVIISDWTNGSVALGSGTSASAAFVAGVLALLRSQGADAQMAVQVLLASARHPKHVRFEHGRSEGLGYGILDAGAACRMYREIEARSANRTVRGGTHEHGAQP